MIDEIKDKSEEFDTLARFIVLSGSNPQLYPHIWPDEQEEGINWITPESEEEIASIIELLSATDSGSESGQIR